MEIKYSDSVYNDGKDAYRLAQGIQKLNNGSIVNQAVRAIGNIIKFPSDINKYNAKVKQDEKTLVEEKEEALRKHIEEREDSKYQRAVSDMRKAGINPNLYNNINVGQYTSSVSSSIENMLKEQLQDEQLSNETFNKIVGVVGTIVGALIFKGKI